MQDGGDHHPSSEQLGYSERDHGVAAHETAQLTSHAATASEESVSNENQGSKGPHCVGAGNAAVAPALATHDAASAEHVTTSTDQVTASAGPVSVSAGKAEKRDQPVELTTPTKAVANRDAIDPPYVAPTRAPRSMPEPAMATPLALAPNSDLVMVETRFAPPVDGAETPVAPRPRRERRSSAAMPDEPLQNGGNPQGPAVGLTDLF